MTTPTGVLCPDLWQQFFNQTATGPAVGYQLFSYAAGTTTPQSTYTDATLTIANPNPILLNSVGQNPPGLSIFLNNATAYKFVLALPTDTNPPQSPIATVDNVYGPLTLVTVPNPSYAITPQELAALITPTNFSYPPGNVLRYGADASGSISSTNAFIQALACNNSVYVPAGTFLANITMPSVVGSGQVLYGDGTSSIIKQPTTSSAINWATSSIVYTEGYIRNLAFNCTSGTANTIDTSGVGGITLQNLYFTDTPAGSANIFLNGTAATFTHDQRLINIQIYYGSANSGKAGIEFGPLSADASVDGFIMNGGYQTQYCMYADSGALTATIANAHPYNAKTNIFYGVAPGAGASKGWTFTNVVFDSTNAGGDLIVLNTYSGAIFNGCSFQGNGAANSCATLNNCTGVMFDTCRFDGAVSSNYCVNETGTSDYTNVLGGDINTVSNFINPPFNLVGTHSVVKNCAGYQNLGQQISFIGSTSATVAGGSTVYLGANGAQSSVNITAFMAPIGNINVQNAQITVDAAPGGGQSFTITLYINGISATAAAGSANPQTISGASAVSTSINVAPGSTQSALLGQQVYLKFVSSGGAASANVRYAINAIG